MLWLALLPPPACSTLGGDPSEPWREYGSGALPAELLLFTTVGSKT